MVRPIQNFLTKNLETICRVILAKTSQKMIVNLLMMVLIDLTIIKFTCQHHISGYVCCVWHLGFFSPIDWNNFYCKTFDYCTLFCLKTWETNTELHSHKIWRWWKQYFFLQFILWKHLFFCPNTENYLGLRGWCPWNYLVWIGLSSFACYFNHSSLHWRAVVYFFQGHGCAAATAPANSDVTVFQLTLWTHSVGG